MKIAQVRRLCHWIGLFVEWVGHERLSVPGPQVLCAWIPIVWRQKCCREKRITHTTVWVAKSHSRKVTLGFPLPLTIMQAVSNTDLDGKASVHESNACWLASSDQNIRYLYLDVSTVNDIFQNHDRSNRQNVPITNFGHKIIAQR